MSWEAKERGEGDGSEKKQLKTVFAIALLKKRRA